MSRPAPTPAEVAAELRKLVEAANDGRLKASSATDRRLLAQIEGAVIALELAAFPERRQPKD